MSTKLSKEDVHLRSQEVQELIGHIPGGFMRYGIGVLFLSLVSR